MSLNSEPFDDIKEGNKTIEIRLFDEKRKNVYLKDTKYLQNCQINKKK